MGRMSWRKNPRGTFTAPETFDLRRDGKSLATAQRLRNGFWFWYGGGCNTCDDPKSLDEVKADAMAHFRRAPSEPPK